LFTFQYREKKSGKDVRLQDELAVENGHGKENGKSDPVKKSGTSNRDRRQKPVKKTSQVNLMAQSNLVQISFQS
jgi:hypothetical protein